MQIDPLAIAQIGPYAVRRFINQGGMAWVFEVEEPTFRAVRALKMLKPHASQGEEYIRFLGEAGELAQLDHPNLITIFDFGQDEATGCYYYVMTYVDGPAMSAYIAQYTVPQADPAEYQAWHNAVGPLTIETLSALSVLHDRGIIHRDIKPANILIGSDNRARLSDLGIAKFESSSIHTVTNQAMGTTKFMSPEQAQGITAVPASDIFSVGLTMYNAYTGDSLYKHIEGVDETNDLAIIGYLGSKRYSDDPIPVTFDPRFEIEPEIQTVIRKALQAKPENRYTDAREMLVALKMIIDGSGSRSIPIQPAPARSRVGLFAGLAAVGLLVGGYAAWEFAIKPGIQKGEVRTRENEVRELQRNVAEMLQVVDELEGLAEPDVRDTIERDMTKGDTNWQNAQDDIKSESWNTAKRSLLRARGAYTDVCRTLADTELPARAKQAFEPLLERQTALVAMKAEFEAIGETDEALAEEWAQFESTMAALAAPAEGDEACAAPAHALEQIRESSTLDPMITSIEEKLGTIGPRLAESAASKASAARDRAKSDRRSARAFADEYRRGENLLTAAKRNLSRDPLKARTEYDEARKAFESAIASIPAIEARDRFEGVERKMPADADRGPARALASKAAEHYNARQWDLAASTYAEAAQTLSRQLDSSEQRRAARNLQKDVEAIRKRVTKIGGERILAAEYDEVARLIERAEKDFSGEDYAAATEKFSTASERLRDIQSRSGEMLERTTARQKELESRLAEVIGKKGCKPFESSSARAECDVATKGISAARKALDDLALAKANDLHAQIGAAITDARSIETRYQDGKPRPPVITRRLPDKDEVWVARNRLEPLRVEASDPNPDDNLVYLWRVDGVTDNRFTGDQFEFDLGREATVSVQVTDSSGQSVESTWQIKIKDMSPTLTVTPSGNLSIARGERIDFKANAADPDGTDVSVQYVLKGKTVSTSSAYSFSETKSGNYRLEIRAFDETGKSAVAQRTIRVVNRAPELSVTPSSVTLESGASQKFVARAADPEKTDVRITWLLDDRAVANRSSYTFEAKKAGKYKLTAKATDQDGVASTIDRTVTVTAGSQYPNPDSDLEREVIAALRTYEATLEAKDFDRLTRIWYPRPTNPNESNVRDKWRAFFRSYPTIGIRLEDIDIDERKSTEARISFTQTESITRKDGSVRTVEWSYESTIVKYADGWKLMDMRGRRN